MRVCLIPAAGASSRMRGGDKLLQDVDGLPCLRVMVDRAKDAGAQVFVTLPDQSNPREQTLKGSDAQIVPVTDAKMGMSASLKAGIRAVPVNAHGVMILPADMPDITSADMRHLWDIFEARAPLAIRATTEDGAPGHPVIVHSGLLPAFLTLRGDSGAAKLLKARAKDVLRVPLKGNRARCDLDTPEDWENWRQARQR